MFGDFTFDLMLSYFHPMRLKAWMILSIYRMQFNVLLVLLALSLLPRAAQAFIPQLNHHNRLIAQGGFNHGTHRTHEIFKYDAVGNILTASNDTAVLEFAYDAVDRLTNAMARFSKDGSRCHS